MTDRTEVVVVGSANVDTAVRVARIPGPGETVLATGSVRSAGGKGANQAVAAARAGGAPTSFLGCLGDDADGALLRGLLAADGVRTDLVGDVPEPTGIALITVDDAAENTIVVVAGANAALRRLSPAQRDRVAGAAVVLAQLEVPMDAVVEAARSTARGGGARFVLNAAPSAPLPDVLWPLVDVLVVNEHEAADQAGTPADDVVAAAEVLLRRVPTVLVTLGSAGVLVARRGVAPVTVPAPAVTAVDTTAAGDTFCGVLAAALADGAEVVEGVRLACAAASLAVQRPGAQDSVPAHAEVVAWRDAIDRAARGG
jgi:ribokinase